MIVTIVLNQYAPVVQEETDTVQMWRMHVIAYKNLRW